MADASNPNRGAGSPARGGLSTGAIVIAVLLAFAGAHPPVFLDGPSRLSPAGRLPSRIPDLSTPRSLPGADVFSTFKDATQDAQFIAPTADQRSLGGKVHISFCQS